MFVTMSMPGATNSFMPVMDGAAVNQGGVKNAKNDAVRGSWLKRQRFAMFIHWGLYSELVIVGMGKLIMAFQSG